MKNACFMFPLLNSGYKTPKPCFLFKSGSQCPQRRQIQKPSESYDLQQITAAPCRNSPMQLYAEWPEPKRFIQPQIRIQSPCSKENKLGKRLAALYKVMCCSVYGDLLKYSTLELFHILSHKTTQTMFTYMDLL